MNVERLIAELEDFDPDTEIVVMVGTKEYYVDMISEEEGSPDDDDPGRVVILLTDNAGF